MEWCSKLIQKYHVDTKKQQYQQKLMIQRWNKIPHYASVKHFPKGISQIKQADEYREALKVTKLIVENSHFFRFYHL